MLKLKAQGEGLFKDRRVLVVGLQRSGIGASLLLSRLGADLTVTDLKGEKEVEDSDPEAFKALKACGMRLRLGGHEEKDFLETDLIVISPGVRSDMPLLKKAQEKGIEVIGELELAYRVVRNALTPVRRDAPFYAVTGTNGKSTVTTLLWHMLRDAGINALLCGNIGKAITMELVGIMDGRTPPADAFVVETSSFQLETIKDFRPSGAVILNITPDHLDRYNSISEYREAKALIGINMTEEDFLILNHDDPQVKGLSERFRAKIYYFSRFSPVKGVYLDSSLNSMIFNLPETFSIGLEGFRLKGLHNIENAMASSLMAILSGVPPDSVKETLKEFRGLEHRTEFVDEIDGVSYINDSKGTNVGALMKSLEGFQRIILIAGGRDKKGDFSILRPLIKERVKALILIGEAREKIKDALGDLTITFIADDMREAVLKAREIAQPGDTVLLSPGCASFDMFRDFEERGRVFKDIVRELKYDNRKD